MHIIRIKSSSFEAVFLTQISLVFTDSGGKEIGMFNKKTQKLFQTSLKKKFIKKAPTF